MLQHTVSRPGSPGPAAATLRAAIQAKTARVGIIGQGYVGLPLAMAMCAEGFDVTGYDVDQSKVDSLNRGVSYIGDVPDAELAAFVKKGSFRGRSDFSDLGERDVISICVPTPLSKTRDPDISYIVSACEQVVKNLRPGQLIVLESTTYPGTTYELVLPMFEKAGMEVGRDFFLCFSPERVDPANPNFSIKNTPRLVGGITRTCTDMGVEMYGAFLSHIVAMSSTQAAEMAKLLENTFRAVNIGLVNEVALMCRKLGLDTWEVIDAAGTKPFGFMKFYPGPGLGGHCIPVDPHYLSWVLKRLNYTARFIELASEINTSMPDHVVTLVGEALNDDRKSINGSRVLVMGVAYKKNVSDTRESPALDVIQLLQNKGAVVICHDPFVPSFRLAEGEIAHTVELDEALLESVDCVVITAAHTEVDWQLVADRAPVIVDTRNALASIRAPRARIIKL